MSDWKQRFSERFEHVYKDKSPGVVDLDYADLLSFIDEVVAEERESVKQVYLTREEAYQKGRAEERKELAAHVEGMKVKHFTALAIGESDSIVRRRIQMERNSTLDDLLAHLRQSDCDCPPNEHKLICDKGPKKIFPGGGAYYVKKEPQGCCSKCKVFTSAVPWGMCIGKDCSCHKKAPQGDSDEKYYELILAVHNKHKGETRHETALRYIREREQGSTIAGEVPQGDSVEGEK